MRNLDDVLHSKSQQFVQIPALAFGRSLASPLVRTLCVLLWLADGNPAVSTSYLALSKFTGKSKESERRLVRQLVQLELLNVVPSEMGRVTIEFILDRFGPIIRNRFPIELIDPKFQLSDVQFRILLSLYKICGKFDESKISMEQLTEEANTNPESARKALRSLEEQELVIVERTKRNFGMLSVNKLILNCGHEKSMREIRQNSKHSKALLG